MERTRAHAKTTAAQREKLPRLTVGAFGSLHPFLRLVRVENLVFIGALSYTGLLLGRGTTKIRLATMLVCLIPAVVLAFGNVTNNLFDVRLDRLGKPWRPLAGKYVAIRTAQVLAGSLALCALMLALLLPPFLFGFAVAMLVLSFLYSFILKRVPFAGNLCVAVQSALVPVYGGIVRGRLNKANRLVMHRRRMRGPATGALQDGG